VGSLQDWAEFLARSADVHLATEVASGHTVCDLIYAGDEAPRQFATKLRIATGEEFQLLQTEEIRADTGLDAPELPPAPTEGEADDTSAPVSLMITRAQRRALGRLGYSETDIRHMTPAEAHRNLGLADKATS